jgi:hypothetical protein
MRRDYDCFASKPISGVDKYVVVRESNNVYNFSKFHHTYAEAKEEAERLCRQERATFYVLEVKGKCYIPETPVTWKEI